MKCPKCKNEVTEDTLRCPFCNSRIGITCKNCGTVNFIFNKVCKDCGSDLLTVCPNCKSVNFADAKLCRKCGYKFEKPKDTFLEDTFLPDNENIKLDQVDEKFQNVNKFSKKEVEEVLLKGLKSENKRIIFLTGAKGSGKSSIISNLTDKTNNENFLWIKSDCTSVSQLTPAGYIQGVFLNLFKLPEICPNNSQYKKTVFNLIKKEFPKFSDTEISGLVNILYPDKTGRFENIFENKTKTFNLLEKTFNKLIEGLQTVFVIENFEYIDGFSYEFLFKYFEKPEIFNKIRLVLTYGETKPLNGWFYYPEKEKYDCYLNIMLSNIEYDEMQDFLNIKKEGKKSFPQFEKDEKYEIYKLSRGNIAYIEQVFALKADCIRSNQPFEISENFGGIIAQRLALLIYLFPLCYKFLIGAVILGKKINVNAIRAIYGLSDEEITDIINYLVQNDYIVPINRMYYEFKSTILWETIYEKVTLDETFIDINEKILDYLNDFTLNSIATLGKIAQNLKRPQLAFKIWSKNVRLTSYIGDASLYVISQKQCLAIINEFDDKETLKIRYIISERLGKILAKTNPKEAMEFLPDALNSAKIEKNESKETELLGYLASCCRKVGNYNGEIECTDAVIEKVQDKLTPLNLALLKCTKLNALIHIGNSGQIINMIDNEILPIFDEFFNKKQDKQSQSVAFVFTTWVKTYLILSKALIMQGNNRAFEVLAILFEIIENNKIEDELFICKVKLALASANTIKGNFKLSKKMLDAAMQVYQANVMDNETIIEWNFIDIINKFMLKKYRGIQETLFQVVTFANNNGDNFTKNILKVLLGKFFKDTNSPKQAMDIYNEQIVYFAKEKMAFCALLTWYMIADTTLVLEGPKAAIEIAEQALEVAQNPKINNFYFQVLLKIILAKSYMSLSDFDTVKINLESAINIAKEYDMQDLLSRVYLIYGDYLQEVGLVKSPKQQEYIMAAKKMYESSINIAKETNNGQIYTAGKNQNQVLLNFCKNNSINF